MTDQASSLVDASSFRDPAGFVFTHDGTLYRQVNRTYQADFDRLVDSGLHAVLVEAGLLVAHEEADLSLARTDDAYRVLRPEVIPTISYPYEWCPAQLRDAALATLRIQDLALDHGMSLRDATAYNLQFHRGRPIHLDTLSFAVLRENEPWVAYRQFCQHFLAPLALMTEIDVRLGRLQRTDIAGIPLDLASELLPVRTRLRPGLLTHLHLQARAQRRYQGHEEDAPARTRSGAFSLRAFRGLVDSLRGTVDRLTWDHGRTTWSDYYGEAAHYSDGAMSHKEELVAAYLDAVEPATVWDLGANTGRFARLAADRGAHVVAFDSDEAAIEQAWRTIRDDRSDVLPLVTDLANPSPRLGWANAERRSLADRGPADLTLALALVHHLAIGNNVPLERVAAYLATLTRHLVIEWVPKDDPKVRQLLAHREDVFDTYTTDGFETGFGAHFTVERREPIRDTDRVLYLLRRRTT